WSLQPEKQHSSRCRNACKIGASKSVTMDLEQSRRSAENDKPHRRKDHKSNREPGKAWCLLRVSEPCIRKQSAKEHQIGQAFERDFNMRRDHQRSSKSAAKARFSQREP